MHKWPSQMVKIKMYLFISFMVSIFSLCVFSQQVDDRYIKTIHIHSSGGSSGGSGSSKNSHRGKILTNSQSRDKHDSSMATRTRSLASQFSMSQSAAHGEYMVFSLKFSKEKKRNLNSYSYR